jgi:nickel-dependent lactate racemase
MTKKRGQRKPTSLDKVEPAKEKAGLRGGHSHLVKLPYGSGEVELTLGPERLHFDLSPRWFPPVADPAEELLFSLADPVGPGLAEVIRPGDRVLLATVDRTRPSPRQLLGTMVRALEEAGARVTVIAATGLHRWMSAGELAEHFGTADALQHDCDGEMLSLGTTSRGTPIELNRVIGQFDKVVTLGYVEPHYLMGFTGGRKLLFPGLGSRRATSTHHLMLAEAGFQLGRLDGNPLDQDVLEMVGKLGLWPAGPFAWSTNVVTNPDDSVVEIFSGHPLQAHVEACRLARRLNTVHITNQCDIAIVTPGGVPASRAGLSKRASADLVQSRKALIPACRAVRPGGVLILLAQCAEGWAADEGSRPLLSNSHPKAIIAELNERYVRLSTAGARQPDAGGRAEPVEARRRAQAQRPPSPTPLPMGEGRGEGGAGAPRPPEAEPAAPDAEADSPASYTAALVFSFILEFRSLEVIVVSALEGLEDTFLLTAPSLAEAMELAEERVGTLSSVGIIRGGRRLIIP